ncbi:hypothetical protein [Clostridium sp. D53t1_180928_C8]|uniref:hypothetical protein n=1 Tax=Clostridium sp. D53t1_180928_C8 TaxID=2787101 RepID=UPI0018AAD7B2|nr:hypothetical protein [Clostridium sp. D53t1_180928_C8]
MKKLLVVSLTVLALVALVGCGEKKEGIEEKKEASNIEQKVETTSLFGKVEKVVGNEVKLKLSDDNILMPEDEDSDKNSFQIDESQLQQLEDGGTLTLSDGTVITKDELSNDDVAQREGIPAEGNVGEGQSNISNEAQGADNSNSNIYSELTFNGESKDLTISAGVEIVNMKTGKTGKILEIKEGSILNVVVDSKTNAVIRVEIMG